MNEATAHSYKLGRNRPTEEALARPRVLYHDFLSTLPAPAPGPLGRYDAVALQIVIRQMYGNDQRGDCTIAGKTHLIGVFKGLANPPPIIFPTALVERDYFRLTGGQDTGLDEITVLEDWRDNKSPPLGAQYDIAGFCSVNAANVMHVKQAVDFLYNGYLGICLPDKYVNPFPSANGFVWDKVGPANPDNGHCIVAIDYNAEGLIILTWGMWGIMTWDAVEEYLIGANGGMMNVVLTKEILERASQRAPDNADWAQLSSTLSGLKAAA